jgi:hypothetical protein
MRSASGAREDAIVGADKSAIRVPEPSNPLCPRPDILSSIIVKGWGRRPASLASALDSGLTLLTSPDEPGRRSGLRAHVAFLRIRPAETGHPGT